MKKDVTLQELLDKLMQTIRMTKIGDQILSLEASSDDLFVIITYADVNRKKDVIDVSESNGIEIIEEVVYPIASYDWEVSENDK